MGTTRRAVVWVDITRDPDAAAYVASHRDGDEAVPTAVTGAGEMIEATPTAIKAHLDAPVT